MNELEKKFQEEAKKRGYTVIRNGYPDFFVVPPSGGIPYFVEVKKFESGRSTKSQQKMFTALEKAGLHVALSLDGQWVEPVIDNRLRWVLKNLQETRKIIDQIHESMHKYVDTVKESKYKLQSRLNNAQKNAEQFLENLNNDMNETFRSCEEDVERVQRRIEAEIGELESIQGSLSNSNKEILERIKMNGDSKDSPSPP